MVYQGRRRSHSPSRIWSSGRLDAYLITIGANHRMDSLLQTVTASFVFLISLVVLATRRLCFRFSAFASRSFSSDNDQRYFSPALSIDASTPSRRRATATIARLEPRRRFS